MIQVDFFYFDSYGCQHKDGERIIYVENLPILISNYGEVDWADVRYVSVCEEHQGDLEGRVFQASGYSYDRGLFVDLY